MIDNLFALGQDLLNDSTSLFVLASSLSYLAAYATYGNALLSCSFLILGAELLKEALSNIFSTENTTSKPRP